MDVRRLANEELASAKLHDLTTSLEARSLHVPMSYQVLKLQRQINKQTDHFRARLCSNDF